jgi:hypothetical protein
MQKRWDLFQPYNLDVLKKVLVFLDHPKPEVKMFPDMSHSLR